MAVTMKDVAARAGVSLKTVSRVINQEASVQKTTREKVLRVVDELGYLPDLSARSLRSARAYAIGLVYDNPNPYYVIGLQEGTLAACREMGYGLQIYPCDSRVPRLTQELINQSQRTRLAGVVLAPPMSENLARIRKLSEAGVNLVRILSASEDPDDGWPCVYVDDRHAAYNITEHLIQLGHTRIGFLWGEKEFGSSVERYKGYVDALADYDIARDKSLIVEGEYSFDNGFRGARRLLALKQRPTAIFGSNDEIAAGVLAAARAAGMNVPYDLSIAGFEDSPFSRQSWPALTTARQATTDIARQATRLLIAQLDDNRGKVEIHDERFSPELIVRGSTAPPRPE